MGGLLPGADQFPFLAVHQHGPGAFVRHVDVAFGVHVDAAGRFKILFVLDFPDQFPFPGHNQYALVARIGDVQVSIRAHAQVLGVLEGQLPKARHRTDGLVSRLGFHQLLVDAQGKGLVGHLRLGGERAGYKHDDQQKQDGDFFLHLHPPLTSAHCAPWCSSRWTA